MRHKTKSSGKSRTGGQHSFAVTPQVAAPRSSFRRNCGLKTTFNSGLLIPVFCEEVLPGDTIKLNMSHVARLATPLKPIMDQMWLDLFWFFVPHRLVWDNWVKFMGEQRNPADSIDFNVPQSVSPGGGYGEMSLQDYMGLPTKIPLINHMSLPLRAYNLIYDEWFRDENLVDSVTAIGQSASDGPDDYTLFNVLRRGKRHDYFTSCLPFPQKGVELSLALAGTADVISDSTNPKLVDLITGAKAQMPLVAEKIAPGDESAKWESATNVYTTGEEMMFDGSLTGLVADLTTAPDIISINNLRTATAIQRLLEKDARGGTRYTESIRTHFGVTSPDQRLQRPEYLGGGTHMIQMSTVPQTSQTDTSAQGNLAAFAVSSASNASGFVQSFTEHGTVIGIISARADLNYQQGLDRQWSRSDRLDFYFPTLANLGEQAVLNKEIFSQGSGDFAADAAVFGYQERWAEYRYKPSKITGLMRSNSAQPLDLWHLAQEFDDLPLLNETFIGEDPPVERVVATPAEPDFLLDAYFNFVHVRPLPTHSIPALTDRF